MPWDNARRTEAEKCEETVSRKQGESGMIKCFEIKCQTYQVRKYKEKGSPKSKVGMIQEERRRGALCKPWSWKNIEAEMIRCVGERKISYFGLARNLIRHLISPNQDDLSYSARTFHFRPTRLGELPNTPSLAGERRPVQTSHWPFFNSDAF